MLVHVALCQHQACNVSFILILFLMAFPMAQRLQPAEHLHRPFTHHSISYLAPLTTFVTVEKSGTVVAERLSDWLAAYQQMAISHQTSHFFCSP